MNKKSLQQFIDAVVKFRDERDWQDLTQFKDTAIATSLEAAELLEHFKWKTEKEIGEYIKKHKNEIEEEMSDVLFNILLLGNLLQTNFDKIFFDKIKKNAEKYPVEKVKGKNPHL